MDEPPPALSTAEEVVFSHDGAAALSYDGDATTEPSEAIEALAIVLTLIALTILFEKVKHGAEHHAGRSLRPIVEALFGELTVLGFLSTVTYCLNQTGAFLALSRLISGDAEEEEGEAREEEEEENEVLELVETIHFAMFFVMVIFMCSVLFEVHHGLQSQKEWCQWDRACHDKAYVKNLLRKKAKWEKKYDAVSSMRGLRGILKRAWRSLLPYLSFLPFLRDVNRENLEDKLEFCALRLEFLKERDSEPPFTPAGEAGGRPKTLGDHFNFGRYLTSVYAKKMAHVVEIDVTTWLVFAGSVVGYFLLYDAVGFRLQALAWAWVLIGWIFHVLSINFEKYLLGIRDRYMSSEFIPKPKLRRLTWGAEGDSAVKDGEKEPLRKLDKGLPMWCYMDIDELDRRRGCLGRALFGPVPRDRQSALYLFGSEGPAMHTLCLRIMLVFSCVYSAQLLILFVPMMARSEGAISFTFVIYCVLAFVPALAFIFNKKRLTATVIQVGSIGPFVLPQAVADSEREEKTSMAVRVLVIYFKLARMTKQFLANPSTFELPPTEGHYTEALSVEEIAELGRMFKLFFDPDGDGFVSVLEFQGLMSTLGVEIMDSQAKELIRAIVESSESVYVEPTDSEDGKVTMSTFAFFQWYVNQQGDGDDKKECAQFLFGLFDQDNSGDVSVLEVKRQMDNMAIGISRAEADQLIQEMDEDGNGVLCEDEFEDLIEDFYPVEFQYRSEKEVMRMNSRI